ncbi:MAG: N-6 DNA methylase [Chloroflexi bacterium]|nr:N-6 DNA methylase [Chloroflexota bacterium]
MTTTVLQPTLPPSDLIENSIVDYSYRVGREILGQRSSEAKKRLGQFLTPPDVARYMAAELDPLPSHSNILDPAIGSGVLACALVERAIAAGAPLHLRIVGYEIDPVMCEAAKHSLSMVAKKAALAGVDVEFSVHCNDFLLECAPSKQYSLFSPPESESVGKDKYDGIIANPPYFKLRSDDERVKALLGRVQGHTNIYTLFLAVALELLAPGGKGCFIVPRSFCSGAYHSGLRKRLIEQVSPVHFHLFESRTEAFREDSVLQENVIMTFVKPFTLKNARNEVVTSTSRRLTELGARRFSRQIKFTNFLAVHNGALLFRLPVTELDEQIVEIVDEWPHYLHHFGWKVSTGPVVAFRSRPWLTDENAVERAEAAPLLWMQNVRAHRVDWPVGHKPQGIQLRAETKRLLLPVRNYVLLRRFSAKEERRRIVAATFLRDQFDASFVGLENHLNYICARNGELSVHHALGLTALLNSALVDRYFRITNGNTQVNAQEIRALPLPSLETIAAIGEATNGVSDETLINSRVFDILRRNGFLPNDFPTFMESRTIMAKIQEAQDILKTLGLPKRQQNEIAALTLLTLAQVSESARWANAERKSLRIHDILTEIRERYGRDYAENTRETIRRQVIHQFIQAGLVERNPDDPTLPTNSPKTHYALTSEALTVIQSYDSAKWEENARWFLQNQRSLIEVYRQKRERHLVPLRLPNGGEYHLSAGPHSELQVAIIEEFGPRFAPGALVLYVGDAADKTLHIDVENLEVLGINLSLQDKLPDVVLYASEKNQLFLVEAVTSHGPISPKRLLELASLVEHTSATPIYVTAFPDFATFKDFLTEIAWDTEVWLAETPTHMIHFNGDKFLGGGE